MRFRSVKGAATRQCLLCLISASSLIQSLSAASPEPIDLADLPEPPPEIRRLIDRGPLEWVSGDRDDQPPAAGKPKLAAETKYRVSYTYRSRAKWKFNQPEDKLTVSVRFTRVDWKATHRIWFLNKPPVDDFWSDRIVRHELDHLNISSDPRHAKRFERELRQESVFEYPVKDGDVVNREFVDQLVKGHVDRIFQDHSDLIAIRYRELDRVTQHGQLPVPQDSLIATLLTESVQADD